MPSLATLMTCLAFAAPQGPGAALSAAVAVRGDTGLSPAEAYASANARVEDHVREQWQQRASRLAEQRLPFWVPSLTVEQSLRRWLADLPVTELVDCVDREDRERVHEFGNSYQTTLWVAEDPQASQRSERQLRDELRRVERRTAVRFGGVAAGWLSLAVLIAWLDRLSRGYMSGRLRLLGVCAGVALPAFAILL